jgi:tetratricopeptide (TPR) repeat protein
MGAELSAPELLAAPKDENSAVRQVQQRAETKASPSNGLRDPFGLKAHQVVSPATKNGLMQKKMRLAFFALGILVVVFYFGGSDESPTKKQGNRKISSSKEEAHDLASILPKLEKPLSNKNAEMFFNQGFREYRERNYSRAMSQFDLVLQIIPDHEMALRYRENARLAIDEEVKLHLEFGKKTLSAGKLREARAHFEAILRLLAADQTNPIYIEAQEELKQVKSEMDGT